MPKLLIDGEEIEVSEGTTVLQAAQALGREIPHFCYHPGLSIAGNCRMCLVEIEKAPKLQISCQTPAQEGMVVHTESEQVKRAQKAVMEFLLIHQLYRSDRTGEVVDARMTHFSFPPRWYYDIMRALDYFQECRPPRDERMEEAIAIIKKKRRKDGRWPLQNRHAGRTFFEMEKPRRV